MRTGWRRWFFLILLAGAALDALLGAMLLEREALANHLTLRLAEERALVAALPRLRREVAAGRFGGAVPERLDSAQFLAELTAAAKAAGVALQSVTVELPVSRPGYVAYPVAVRLTGPLLAEARFLRILEGNARLLEVVSWQAGATSGTVLLEVFAREASAVPASPALTTGQPQ